MNSASFEALSEHFTEKLAGLCEALAIESCMESTEEEVKAESCQLMESLWDEVEELSTILTLIRNKCTDQRKALSDVQDVKQKLLMLEKSVHYTKNNIPPHLPTVSTSAASDESPQGGVAVQMTVAATPACTQGSGQGDAGNSTASSQTHTKSNVSVSKQPRPPCSLIEYLIVDEFDEVPKYMKGRLTYQQVNTVIDELNKAFTAKYKLLRQKKSTLNDRNRKRYETLKMQESKDTKGVYFLVESDIKEWSSLQMSKETRTVLTVLRHCGRLYEIRGDGHVYQYFLVESDIKEWSNLQMSKETRTVLTVLRHCGRLYEIRGGGHVRYAMIEMY